MEQTEKDYNTRRPQMIIPEYGRNIQKMVAHTKTLKDKEERNKIANAIISVMGQLNPHLRDIADFKHKLWDHLFIISNFELDVDSPYPIPDKETIFEKPEKMDYPTKKIKFKHYGKSVEDLINVAITFEEGDEKKALIETIVNLMKKSYLTFNRDSVDDDLIIADLKTLSNNQLNINDSFSLVSTNEVLAMSKKKRSNSSNSKHQKNNNRPKQNNYKKKRY
ncbi:MAG: DUF4290 domain-containing protein [Vicingus serpentipes]|nr:DUF4290 domain-containing protein [Vicingus serpentipes]